MRLLLVFTIIVSTFTIRAGAQQAAATAPPTAASAAAGTPVEAVQAFVADTMSADYAGAWHLFTQQSKKYIIDAVARDEKVDASDVRAAFDTTDQRVVRGFWTSFHASFSKTGTILQGHTPKQVFGNSTSAVVAYDGSPARWLCFYEDGEWHVGYAESFLIGGPMSATASPKPASTAVEAVKNFVDAVLTSNYAAAWHVFSNRSKDYMLDAVVQENKLTAPEVRAAFDAADPPIVRGFWTSFHAAFAKAATPLKDEQPRQTSGDAQSAVVVYPGTQAKWLCFYEDGEWHVGYAESFLIKP